MMQSNTYRRALLAYIAGTRARKQQKALDDHSYKLNSFEQVEFINGWLDEFFDELPTGEAR